MSLTQACAVQLLTMGSMLLSQQYIVNTGLGTETQVLISGQKCGQLRLAGP